jgi:DNA polymerase-2
VTLAQKQHRVPPLCQAESSADGFPPIRDLNQLIPGSQLRLFPPTAFGDLFEDGGGFFPPGILVGEDYDVAVARGQLALEGTFAQVPLPGGSEHDDQAAPGMGSDQGEHSGIGLGCVGVVHDHPEGLAPADRLHPSRHPFKCRDCCSQIRQPERIEPQHGQGGGQQVLDVVAARQVEPGCMCLAGVVERELRTGKIGLDVLGPKIGFRVCQSVAQHRSARLFDQVVVARIVEVDHAEAVSGESTEQVGLVRPVLFKASVELEVFVADVGTHPGCELDLGKAPGFRGQPVGGGLDHGVLVSRIGHPAQQAVDIRGFRGRLSQGIFDDPIFGLYLDRGNEAAGFAERFQKLVYQPHGRALAVGTRHSDDGQLPRGVFVEGGGQSGHAPPGVGHLEIGYPLFVAAELLLVEDRRRTAADRLFDEAMPVGVKAWKRCKQIPSLDTAGVVGQAAHGGLRAAPQAKLPPQGGQQGGECGRRFSPGLWHAATITPEALHGIVGCLMNQTYEGFVVHSYARSAKGRNALYLLGRLSDGSTFAIVENRYQPNFYVREGDSSAIEQTIASMSAADQLPADGDVRLVRSSLCTMDGEPCRQLVCATRELKRQVRDALQLLGTRTYESDLRVADQFRLERQIHGPIRIRGEAGTGRYVTKVFVDPEVEAGIWQPKLSVLSIDIETDVRTQTVRAVALSLQDPFGDAPGDEEEVLFLGPELHETGVRCFNDEKVLLQAFRDRLVALDPDVITGWNVIDFDLQVLSDRFRRYRLPFTLGRSREAAVYLPQSEGRGSRVIVPGRQVWDGVRIVRASPDAFEDYSLETVAGAILGYGKRIEILEGEDRIGAIERLYREQPEELCAYCLEDARLVHRIMGRTGLFQLTLRRCVLIGVAPDLAWTSIAAFEHLYTEALHQRGMVAPTFGVDALPMEGAPGGIILAPRPGVFDEVLVFDFQSLYPSIIRTFNIDPLSYAGRRRGGEPIGGSTAQESPIRAPNGAVFSREPGILPELLDRFFERRAEAQAKGDAVASFVYKIIMNSFYGVLGARSCRFAGSDLAGAITSFGQRILGWCKDFLEDLGYAVLYGDTDSLFVTVLAGTDAPPLSLDGQEICSRVNRALEEYLVETYGVEPRLTLKFEKRYERFFLPPLRGGTGQGEKGRAKGYAGLLAASGGEEATNVQGRIEVRGMEAVRRDWTDLAHDFQLRLLELLFLKCPLEEIQSYIRELVELLYRGELDDKLVYRKALRKSIAAYTRNTPPHVKAAALLPRSEQRGLIRYLITREGPQPQGRINAPLDYDHYLERQLMPIASAFTEVLKTDLEALFGRGGQLWLF